MDDIVPRLLLISEVTLAKTIAGVQANPTLYNMFKRYPPDRLFSVAPRSATRNHPPIHPFDRNYGDFEDQFFPRPRRGSRFVSPVLDRLELQILQYFPHSLLSKIRDFRPELILVSPIGSRCLQLGRRLQRMLDLPSVVYFMDFWMPMDQRQWIGGGIQRDTRDILMDASGWLMISDELREAMQKQYGLDAKPTLVVHNPVDVPETTMKIGAVSRKGRFRIVYAGSIHSMHADSLIAVAEAVFRLRNGGLDIELVLHTHAAFEDRFRKVWEKFGVVLGGLLPYEELLAKQKDSDMLLVCLAFEKSVQHMAKFSVLTKITDYMQSGVPILVVGPSNCASINFVKKWNCGIACETIEVEGIMRLLKEQLERPQSHLSFANNAFEALTNHFSVTEVHGKLSRFLCQMSSQMTS